ncbi:MULTISPECIES: hypothetical protein [Mycolicibacterium]|uniref:hypothetical protein n=1 Tax=Mycolicibacterium TaxID=1866885 RepID=UPI0012693C6E|nr:MULTISPECIES: hypothetical protein [Mycolicibacterium]MCG7579699.1 hypothetical protein [Mycolicibacterium sp. OfavD-34-C]QFS91075.1 hypothetical protein FIV07_09955 [Mycobacterium sp. THAF192]
MAQKREHVAEAGIVMLAAMRIAVGVVAWVRPDVAATSFGMSAPDGQARYLWRLFGVRDAVIGLATVSTRGSHRRTWAKVGLACDVADGTAGALAGSSVNRVTAAAMVGVPAAAVAFGAWALRR